MISASPSLVVRSSLEEMLDSLQRNEDVGKNSVDLPPALPSRPASKARLPKRPVPAMFGVSPEVEKYRKQDVNFDRKKVACGGESPYTMAAVHKSRMSENGGAGLATPPPPAADSGWDNNSIDYYIKKQLRVWCRVQNGQWELGIIRSTVGGKASVTLLDGAVITVSTLELLPANAEILDGVDNLVELGYLNEPSVLSNLQYRYHRDVIYTMAGPVLLAINPFKDILNSGSDVIMAYKEKILDCPHVYSVAAASYSDMMTDGVNQTIIISGESGAGKSVNAKLAIEYLVGSACENSEVACKIRESGCILEAFGNAKTSRNKNSTRFGKLIDILYNKEGTIQGAYIHTLHLEKSRISQLCRSERSYHVFYQMCAGASSDMRDKLNLRMASEYKYLNQSGCLKVHDVDDAQNFQKLMEAMDILVISQEDQEHVFKLLAAILWLGNISFEVTDHENHVTVMIDEASRSAAKLMGCRVKELTTALSTNKNQTLKLQQAIDTRDALAQFIYTILFNWLVETINKSLKGDEEHSGTSISILDTYGFESFQKNSFDQLLINYADERLQQHFIRHLFKLEQEEYESEGIDWKKLEFVDNQDCLDIFETKNVGIISILDEASNACEATDLTLFNTIKHQLGSTLRFNNEKAAFKVQHYAGEVQYETNGFLVKNRNTLQSDTLQFLSSCCKNFLKSDSHASDLDKESVGTKFKDQLFKLIQRMEKSKPRFIRCIRPNAKQLHGMFEKDIVLHQLRCSGILETVKMSKSRYHTRMTHQQFANRFGCLLSDNILCHDPLSTSVAILQQYRVLPEMYQLGYTKIYFRADTVNVLDKLRQQVKQGTYKVENRFPCGRVLCDYRELMSGIVILQSFIRGEISRRVCKVSRKPKHEVDAGLVDRLSAVVHIQSVTRGWLARRYFSHLCRWKKSAFDSSKTRQKSCNKVSETNGVSQDVPNLPADVEELKKLVTKAEVSLGQKEHENSALREQVRQFETRWSEHEIKMKSVEETWQKQMASLQKSLAAAKKSLHADESSGDISSTENAVGNYGGDNSTVDHLAKEFEQKRQNFDDDARALVETKTIQIPYAKQLEEFRKVKERFEIWKKEYKHRLRETRTKLVKGLNGEGGKQSWWGKLSKRYTPV
ncbi:myosin-2-like [Rutidosis leptorrhynchoides]|uniref:myosin-2-like n=1 Tax=Rutidosis leptorrhynchoides TaxID=125765 RepID=UPI003A990BC8